VLPPEEELPPVLVVAPPVPVLAPPEPGLPPVPGLPPSLLEQPKRARAVQEAKQISRLDERTLLREVVDILGT
jgi:hypothetical protein